mgnify:CR=1 FL=1
MAGLPFGGKNDTGDTSENVTPANAVGEQTTGTTTSPTPPTVSKRESKKASKQQAKYGVFDPNELKKGRGLFGFLSTGGGKLTIGAVILAIIAGAGVYLYTTDSSERIQQLVLLNDMPANTLISMTDVQPVEVPLSAVQDPTLLVTSEQINSGVVVTKVALKRNTVLVVGAVGNFSRLSDKLPDGYQMVSIVVDPANAAGGSVTAGDIVDIYGAGGSGEGSVFSNGMKGVRVLDVIVNPSTIAKEATVDPNTGKSDKGSDSPDLKSGIGSVYKLQVTPAQAADIARGVTGGIEFYLVLTNGVSSATGEIPIVVTPEAPIPSTPLPNPLVDNPVGDLVTDAIGGGEPTDANGATGTATQVNPDGTNQVAPDTGTGSGTSTSATQ